MGLIKNHHRLLGQLLGHQVGYLWVQQVVVAVHNDVGMKNLKTHTTSTVEASHANGPIRSVSGTNWWSEDELHLEAETQTETTEPRNPKYV